MNSSRLDYVFREDGYTRKMWKGFLAPDVILEGEPTPPFPHFYVLNTAPSFAEGEHWCVIFVFQDGCEFFDPYGNPPEFFGLTQSVMKHCHHIISNRQRIQSFFSLVCGHHCIFYATMRAREHCRSEILSVFTNNYRQNDDWVFNWVAKRFGREVAEIQI